MKSLKTAIDVLKVFSNADGDLSVADITALSGLRRSHVSKILGAFRDGGLLTQDANTRRYSTGVDLFELGVRYVNAQQIARDALPIMRQLVDRCRHSATLSVLHEDHALHLLAVEGPLYLDGRWRVGNRLPLHATSAGQTLLAWADGERLEEMLSRIILNRITPRTITDLKRLRKVLREVRASGIAVTRGQSVPGLAAMAVPVFDARNVVTAALGIIVPDQLFDGSDLAELQASLIDAARALSLRLAAPTYPFGGEEVAHAEASRSGSRRARVDRSEARSARLRSQN